MHRGTKRLLQFGGVGAMALVVLIVVLAGAMPARATSEAQRVAANGNLVKNGSFDEGGTGVPADWYFDAKNKSKGQVSVDAGGHSGRRLVLQPTSNNRDEGN